jgi:hypothetical protein
VPSEDEDEAEVRDYESDAPAEMIFAAPPRTYSSYPAPPDEKATNWVFVSPTTTLSHATLLVLVTIRNNSSEHRSYLAQPNPRGEYTNVGRYRPGRLGKWVSAVSREFSIAWKKHSWSTENRSAVVNTE